MVVFFRASKAGLDVPTVLPHALCTARLFGRIPSTIWRSSGHLHIQPTRATTTDLATVPPVLRNFCLRLPTPLEPLGRYLSPADSRAPPRRLVAHNGSGYEVGRQSARPEDRRPATPNQHRTPRSPTFTPRANASSPAGNHAMFSHPRAVFPLQ